MMQLRSPNVTNNNCERSCIMESLNTCIQQTNSTNHANKKQTRRLNLQWSVKNMAVIKMKKRLAPGNHNWKRALTSELTATHWNLAKTLPQLEFQQLTFTYS